MARITPEDDYNRLAERLQNQFGNFIVDKDTFDTAYNSYLSELGTNHGLNTKTSKDKTFNKYKKMSKGRVTDKKTFTQAGGKNLAQDRKQNAKVIVTNEKEYIRRGAKNVDLKGYDTKKDFNQRFKILGRSGKKIVYARPVQVTIKGTIRTYHRDKKGRYVSVKRNKK